MSYNPEPARSIFLAAVIISTISIIIGGFLWLVAPTH